ncbi:MAG: murein L,D-transpeptidase catalytic domain family protein [Chitinophagaceae bacterium]|nr:murein L,D-transpeptidase catalytic domain family protein [Chitinophagaceae bacterium]
MDPALMVKAQASLLYESLNLEEQGMSRSAFEYAYRGYLDLLDKDQLNRPGILTICDLSQSSRRKRLYILDLLENKILLNTFVAHGRNSGGEFATRFSNRLSSLQTSLGFYVTGATYRGEHGLSLRMQGKEPGINDKAYRRAIVLHGAAYIGQGFIGRSFGCPAVPREESALIINLIKYGTCLFIYHPEKRYLGASRILND